MELYRVLLADDEAEIRQGISRKIDWAAQGFELAGEAEKKEAPEQEVPEQPKPEKPPKQPRPHTFWGWIKDMNRRLWGMIGALFVWTIRVAKVLCRWAWNAALLCAAVPVVCAVGFFLICTGTLGVLLVQGYPALGLLLGSIGIVVCGCGVLVFACTLIWKKPNNNHKEVGDHA